jgi:lysyl-tRNA synthetase class 2
MSTWKELTDNTRLNQMYRTKLTILRLIREFFWSKNFIEAETPIAVCLPSLEPYLDPIPVTFHDPHQKAHQFYLHTSPEFALKKLLAAGFTKLFEISKCFRNYEEFGGTHNTEFTMLEWYRAPGEMEDFMNDTEELFKFVANKIGVPHIAYKGNQINIHQQWDRKTMKQIWQEYAHVSLDDYLTFESIKKLAEEKGYDTQSLPTYEDIFFKIFLNEIEPFLGINKPIFVYNYPTNMCSLSRTCAHDDRYAERTEIYIGGLELANGFGELGDGAKQQNLLEKDLALKKNLGKPTWEIDTDFIKAINSGFPNAAGIALGIDRMVMLFTGAHTIDEVIFESVSDQLGTL